MSDHTEALYMINDSLSQLADGLGVEWLSDDEQDTVLNDLTHRVAEELLGRHDPGSCAKCVSGLDATHRNPADTGRPT